MFDMSETQKAEQKKREDNAVARGNRFFKKLAEALRRNGLDAKTYKPDYSYDKFLDLKIGEDRVPISVELDKDGTGWRREPTGKLRISQRLDGKRAKSHLEPKDGYKVEDWIVRVIHWHTVEQVRKQREAEKEQLLAKHKDSITRLLKKYPSAPIWYDESGIKISLDKLGESQTSNILAFLSQHNYL